MPLFLAILFLSCAQFGSQIFMPALPAIAIYFDISQAETQQIIMLFFISFGLSQLVYGPWSDRVGRRKIFLIGQSLFVLGSLLCAVAITPSMLVWGRVLQGAGAGATLIISRTLLSDQLTGTQLKQAMASLAIAASVISVMAPFIGGLLTSVASWQLLFVSVSLYFLMVGLIGFLWLAPQVEPIHSRSSQAKSLTIIFKDFWHLLIEVRFILTAFFKWLPNLLFFTSATFLPFEIQQKLLLSAQEYGQVMMIPACGLIVGTCLTKLVLKSISYHYILLLFWPLLVAAGTGFYYLPFNLINSLFCYSLLMICIGAYYSASLHLLVESNLNKAGAVYSLSGAIEMLCFSALAILLNRVWVHDSHSLGLLYLLVSLVLLISWLTLNGLNKKAVALQLALKAA